VGDLLRVASGIKEKILFHGIPLLVEAPWESITPHSDPGTRDIAPGADRSDLPASVSIPCLPDRPDQKTYQEYRKYLRLIIISIHGR
jgi:hypothetical protein